MNFTTRSDASSPMLHGWIKVVKENFTINEQPHPAIGESNSGMPRAVHVSLQSATVSPECHPLVGCGPAETLASTETLFCSIHQSNVGPNAPAFSEGEFTRFIVTLIIISSFTVFGSKSFRHFIMGESNRLCHHGWGFKSRPCKHHANDGWVPTTKEIICFSRVGLFLHTTEGVPRGNNSSVPAWRDGTACRVRLCKLNNCKIKMSYPIGWLLKFVSVSIL